MERRLQFQVKLAFKINTLQVGSNVTRQGFIPYALFIEETQSRIPFLCHCIEALSQIAFDKLFL